MTGEISHSAASAGKDAEEEEAENGYRGEAVRSRKKRSKGGKRGDERRRHNEKGMAKVKRKARTG